MIVKPYVSAAEKGVLLISFEAQLAKIVGSSRFTNLEDRYSIIFIPSWSGLYSPPLFTLAARASSEFFVMPVHANERRHQSRLGRYCHMLPFNAASWVNDDLYGDAQIERDIDCLIVANFASFKRHWRLFQALQGLPEQVQAVCVGVPHEGRTQATLLREARDYGVDNRITIVENPTQEKLREYFRRAKVFCAMSFREGSYIAVAEALMSGTPVVMFRNAHIGTKDLIGRENGALVRSIAELRERIVYFLGYNGHQEISIAARAMVGARGNSWRLNESLRQLALDQGKPWTCDVEPFFSRRLSFFYFDIAARERFRDDYEYLLANGICLGESGSP